MPDEPQQPAPILPMAEASPGKGKLAKKIGAPAAVIALALVGVWEGKSNDPYFDIVHVETVCYGETRVEMRHYSDAECSDMLADALGDFGRGVIERNPELVNRPYQLAAATSLSYNIGLSNYRRSTVAKRFDRHDWRGGCDAFLFWNRAGGKIVPGLANRRAAERKVCMEGL